MIRADFHCHTRYSHDCFASVAEVMETAKRRELTHLAITDHNAIEGALRARDQARGLEIIIGCEISLAGGAHLIGLFLERLPSAETMPEIMADIHAQGGLVYVPHPFHPRAGLLGLAASLDGADALEVCSGYEPPANNERAAQFARQQGMAMLAGSDAHYGVDVGRACVEFPDVNGTLTLEILRRAPRRLYAPSQDLAGLHARDAAVRAHTLPRVRRLVPSSVRRCARWANWVWFRRRIAKGCGAPVRKEFVS